MTMSTSQPSWESISTQARNNVSSLITDEFRIPPSLFPPDSLLDVTTFARESGWLTPKELEITASSATAILRNVRERTWSAEEVARAFLRAAGAAHELTNCLTDFLPTEALTTAKALDIHLSTTGKPIGPLHGLPISLKDNFNIAGRDSTVGFVSKVGHPASSNATLVDILTSLGAVLYCKTNVPTAMMIAETVNNTFGRTVNPLNRNLTSGGSSGGESALIAFGASPLGVGTDIGGSLRIPAACTGIFTLRPSLGRFTTQGCTSGMGGQEAVASVNGPMARTLDDMKMYCEAVVGARPWELDPKCVPIPWRDVERKEKLKIAVCWDDGVVRPTPPVARALRETVEKLKGAGHEVVEWDSRLHARGLELLGRMFVADGGKSIRKALEPVGEPFRPEMSMYESARELGTWEMWQLQLERWSYQKEFLDLWRGVGGLDAILGPTTPYATTEHGKLKYVGYTGVFNVVDYSAVSFPCGVTVDKDKDQPDPQYTPLSDHCRDVHDNYNADVVHGMPVSLQLIANRLEEEKVLSMTETVLKAIHG
ncbi:acetamidase-like protein [Periconia macrospinosa]|uniref:amidase n=1 Tax=Periconia macrospinosa TaxID=97972 RepID=A0A2V1D6L2_9PLEO|nr:acetamidase-like protein [Periconia macrospinosa]